ncbi:MAG: hypothetical protein KGM43_07805 [Planctomycetota bacterium]|nr:hypothetical protein [Planctomycetota bacterium]
MAETIDRVNVYRVRFVTEPPRAATKQRFCTSTGSETVVRTSAPSLTAAPPASWTPAISISVVLTGAILIDSAIILKRRGG